MDIERLIGQIEFVDVQLRAEANKAVNRMLTVRNWLIGYYIVEYEQKGEDRAKYGVNLIDELAGKITIKGLSSPELSRCRQFYHCYNYFLGTVSQELQSLKQNGILGTVSLESLTGSEGEFLIRGTVTPELRIFEHNSSLETTAKALHKNRVPSYILINKLAYSHFIELIKINEAQKRLFYEIECIKGTWSVRELKRQINSLYFERSGISTSPATLSKKTLEKTSSKPTDTLIKDIYAFEFLGLPAKDAVEESDLETALLDHLREFI